MSDESDFHVDFHQTDIRRRTFIKTLGLAGFGLAGFRGSAGGNDAPPNTQPPMAANGVYLGNYAAPPVKNIKIAFIGLGARGAVHFRQLVHAENVEIVGVCDLYEDVCRKMQSLAREVDPQRFAEIPAFFGGDNEYEEMLRKTRPDAVWISTPWEWHAPMAIDCMRSGAHALVEVPLATSLDDLWEIVNTAEATRRHCMMLENVNYGREELMFLNMCRQGVFGNLLHGEAAYIHDLRFQMRHYEEGRGTGSWRTRHWAKENGNLYPTHGLGPVAQYMNLARGEDNFRRLVAFSSPARNRALWVEENTVSGSPLRKFEFEGGDINTSIIKTTLGRTVMVQWDESSPRPYTRHNLIQGTRGTGGGFPARLALEYTWKTATPELRKLLDLPENKPDEPSNFHEWIEGSGFEAFYEYFDHPLWVRMKELAKKHGGHGGMDAVMNFRVVECLHRGEPLDQNVYEGAFWSAVTPLSIVSVSQDGMPQDFPDFTRGRWRDTKPLGIVS